MLISKDKVIRWEESGKIVKMRVDYEYEDYVVWNDFIIKGILKMSKV